MCLSSTKSCTRPEEIRHVGILAVTTAGFPTTIAALSWIGEALGAETPDRR